MCVDPIFMLIHNFQLSNILYKFSNSPIEILKKGIKTNIQDSDGTGRQVQWVSLSACLAKIIKFLQPGWKFW